IPPAYGPLEDREAEEREMPEPPLEHVLGGEPGDGRVVGMDLGQARVPDLVVEVDRRDAGPHDLPRALRRRGPGDDPVAVPALDPGRHLILERSLLDVHGPGTVLADVLRDAVEDRPTEGRRRLDDQGHVGQRNSLITARSIHGNQPLNASRRTAQTSRWTRGIGPNCRDPKQLWMTRRDDRVPPGPGAAIVQATSRQIHKCPPNYRKS